MKNGVIREISTKIDVKEKIVDIYNYLRKLDNKLNDDEKSLVNKHLVEANFYDFYQSIIYSGGFGEFYSPRCVSELIYKLVGPVEGESIYEPTIGTGALINCFYEKNKIYGQEFNINTFQITKSLFPNAEIAQGDTLKDDKFEGVEFDYVISNPPFSTPWDEYDHEKYYPVKAPKSKSDMAFLQHNIYKLKEDGICISIMFPGILYRGGREQKIRKHFVDSGYVQTIISLPANMFASTSIPTCAIILSKQKNEKVLFVDAGEMFIKKKKNEMTEEQINKIADIVHSRKEVEFISKLVDKKTIEENEYSLSINSYVEKYSEVKEVDIVALEKEIKVREARRREMQLELDAFIEETFHK